MIKWLGLATALFSTGAAAEESWMPLDENEIASARPCITRFTLGTGYIPEVAVCAGGKKIASGVMLPDKRLGKLLPTETQVDVYMDPVLGADAPQYLAMTSLLQSPPHLPWSWTYYVLSGAQLDAIIAKARANPEWSPQ